MYDVTIFFNVRFYGLVTEGGEFSVDLGGVGLLSLALVVPLLGVSQSLGLQSLDAVLVLPADLVTKSAEARDFSAWKASDLLEGGGDLKLLLDVEWWWAAIEALESLVSGLASSGLVGEHTSDHSLDHHGWGTVVEWTVLGVGGGSLVHLLEHDKLVSVEVTSDEDALASHNGDVVTSEELLGDDGAQSTGEVIVGVDDDVLL